MCGLPWLTAFHACCLLQNCQSAGFPTNGYLLRPQTTNRKGFKDSAFTTSALNKRLQHHLQQMGELAGESSHGLRRGTVIHDHQQQGASLASIGLRLQHVQPGGPQTMQYLDTSRETERPCRKRRQLS